MENNENNVKRIFDKQTKTWFEVSPEEYKKFDTWRTNLRKREQYHGHCMCPKNNPQGNPRQERCARGALRHYCNEPTPIEKRVYSDEQLYILMRECHKWQEEHPEDSRAWAYELNLLMAPQKGELPVLRWSDIENSRIVIRRRQIYVEATGEIVIRDIPKNGSVRYYPISDMINDFLHRLEKRNNQYYPNHELLFLPSPGRVSDMIHPGSLYQFHIMMCSRPEKQEEKISVIPGIIRGPHAFRRTHESGVMDAGGSRELAGKLYGNTEKAIQQHYELPASSDTALPIINQVQSRIFSSKINGKYE